MDRPNAQCGASVIWQPPAESHGRLSLRERFTRSFAERKATMSKPLLIERTTGAAFRLVREGLYRMSLASATADDHVTPVPHRGTDGFHPRELTDKRLCDVFQFA